MTTQATQVTLKTQKGDLAICFNANSTDDQWNEQTDRVNSLSLYKVIPIGTILTHALGSYADGCACFRIRNTATNQVKAIENLPMLNGEHWDGFFRLHFPVRVEQNDVVEVFCTAEQS